MKKHNTALTVLNRAALRTAGVGSFVVAGALALGGCSEPPPTCQVSSFLSYGSKWAQTAGDATTPCGGKKGETVGFASYNPRNPANNAPDLTKASLSIRTSDMGNLVVAANGNGVVDPNENKTDFPFALGAFKSIFPDNDICAPQSMSKAHEVLAAIPGSIGDPEDPSDDIAAQPAVDLTEEWSDVQVFVTAAAEGTQVKAHYKVTDNTNSCTAEYDTLSVFPTVSCEDDEPSGAPVNIASIQEAAPVADGTRPVQIVTADASGLAVGDTFTVAGVDDDAGTITYNSTYTVATVSADGKTIVTNELDPYGGPQEPDPEVDGKGTIQKIVASPNDKFCSAVAIPTDPACDPTAANAPLTPPPTCSVGSGINPAYKVKCDPDTFLCLLDADPKTAKLPIVNAGQSL